jgi:bifunctional UDP-N-acetylglucosamine pyrophosphorylase / glucosamine-1-phosphate N-acetyltransferase
LERLLIVPAAGTGSRLKSPLPKLLVPIAGRAMIDHVLALYAGIATRAALVVQPAALALVREHLASTPMPVEFLVQPEPTGMLDAIMLARPAVERLRPRRVWITWCDQVALLPSTIDKLRVADDAIPEPLLALPTCRRAAPYVHFDRDGGRITRVRHRREGDPLPEVGEADAGLFDLSLRAFLDDLPAYAAAPEIGARTGERNFVPFVSWMSARGPVATVACSEPEEADGVNTPEELERVEAHLRARAAR